MNTWIQAETHGFPPAQITALDHSIRGLSSLTLVCFMMYQHFHWKVVGHHAHIHHRARYGHNFTGGNTRMNNENS